SPRVQSGASFLPHLPGSNKEDPAAVEVAEHLLRKRGGSRRHRCRALADRRLRAHLAARMKRVAEDAVEQEAGRADLVRDAHLAEDLALSGNERVEPGGDAEEMEC